MKELQDRDETIGDKEAEAKARAAAIAFSRSEDVRRLLQKAIKDVKPSPGLPGFPQIPRLFAGMRK